MDTASDGNELCFVDRHVLFTDVSAILFWSIIYLYLCVYPNVFTQYVVPIKTSIKGGCLEGI